MPQPETASIKARAFGRALELHKAGRTAEAITIYQSLLAETSHHPELNHYLGMALHQQGDASGKRYLMRAVQLEPQNPLFSINLGRVLLNASQYDEAATRFRAVLERAPQDTNALHLLGRSLRLGGHIEAALAPAAAAFAAKPTDAQIALDYADALAQARHNAEAAAQYLTVLRLSPRNAEALRRLANAYRVLNRADDAVDALDQALADAPDDPYLWCERGEALEEAGSFDDARACYQKALSVQAAFPVAVANLLKLKGQADADLVGEAKRHLSEQRISNPLRVQLHFSLGRYFESEKDFAASFHEFSEANRIVGDQHPYDRARTRDQFDRLITAYPRDLFERQSSMGHPSERPIFIVGMPRSGTTLTEQILSSHPDISGAGELGFFNQLAYELARDSAQPLRPFAYLDTLGADAVKYHAGRFLGELDRVSIDARHVTDKMPLNFMHVGLIRLLFPQAKIIHCWRNPMDNCLSCFVENMHQEQRYSTSLPALGHHYQQYHRLMAHWRSVLPGAILDVRYEDVVADLEPQARRLLDFCGVEWDDNCLEFYKTERAVTTPSKWQVRQPIYKTSLARWRRFETHLQPLREALEPLLQEQQLHGQAFALD